MYVTEVKFFLHIYRHQYLGTSRNLTCWEEILATLNLVLEKVTKVHHLH